MRKSLIVAIVFLLSAFLIACGQATEEAPPAASQPESGEAATAHPMNHTPAASGAAPVAAVAPPDPVTLDISRGQEIGSVYEAFLSPHQEPGEEKDTPSTVPQQFHSTTPSLLRSERQSRGHGVLRFTNDLSRAYVDVQIEGLNIDEIVMFHIHCGTPDQLGPIIVDFAQAGDLKSNIADGMFSVEITNEVIERTTDSGEGLVGAFTMGCSVPASVGPDLNPMEDKTRTVASLERYARQGELYFNLHTSGQVYFGDMRGQLRPVSED